MPKDCPEEKDEYRYYSGDADHTSKYIWRPVFELIGEMDILGNPDRIVLDVGCGNGAFAAELKRRGFRPLGIDPSESGIKAATLAWPGIDFRVASAYDDLATSCGRFPLVISLEVVEHLYAPREFAARIWDALLPGGTLILTTPFHGYWKNLLIAMSGKFDRHFSPLWDHGHIKFWSCSTLRSLLSEAGFQEISFSFAGRIYPLSKSVIAVAKKPC